ncbi:MAG: aminodeoxychorismate synthase component I [Acinetobacter sp.]|nr:aminodeoxychorismate synthase component I [Acinetobacter sp.]
MQQSTWVQTLPFTGSIAQLLQQLSSLTALVYLQDQDQPTIAFLPQDYWCVVGDQLHYYQRHQLAQNLTQNLAQHSQHNTLEALNHYHLQASHLHHAQATHQRLQAWQHYTPNTDVNTTSSQGFSGGYIGFVSYDEGASQFIQLQTQHAQRTQLFIGCYTSYIQYNEQQQFVFHSQDPHAEHIYHYLCQQLNSNTTSQCHLQQPCQSRWQQSQYAHAFQQVQDYILAGDCYQINLTQEFTATIHGELLAMAESLWQRTQAPFSGYLKLHDFELLSCSPELFIEWQSNRHIKTRPIKGTLPRHSDPQQDEANKQRLQHSQKDQAENVMIVDLLRNDLSLYAEIGSVKTTKLFEVESFNQVHHLVSEVQATLKPESHPWHVLLQALPGGSITGAPKIRAMQIIDELEQQPRGAYCGSLGYFNFNATGRWNILIRTLQKHQQQLSIWAGGGITIASQVDAEYQECFDKIQAILSIVNQYVQKSS